MLYILLIVAIITWFNLMNSIRRMHYTNSFIFYAVFTLIFGVLIIGLISEM